MSTISSAIVGTATAYSNQRKIDRTQNGVLWAIHFSSTGSGAPQNIYTNYSTDNGATWSSDTLAIAGGGSNYTMDGSLFIDLDDNAHIAFRDCGYGYIYYARGVPNAARTSYTWTVTQITSNTLFALPDIVAFRDPANSGSWVAFIVYSYVAGSSGKVAGYRLAINPSGTVGATNLGDLNAAITGTQNSNYGFPSLDFHHTGDGKTVAGGSPDIFLTWSNGDVGNAYGIRFRKAAYSSGAWTWGSELAIDTSRYIALGLGFWLNCLWDGTRVILAGYCPSSATNDLFIYDVNLASDTKTTSGRVLIQSTGNDANEMFYGSASYDSAGNVHVFGRGSTGSAGSRPNNRRRWVRSTNALDVASIFDSAGNDQPYISARRGNAGSRIDYLYTKGSASPYSVVSGAIVLNTAPNAPTLTAPGSAASIDRTIAQTFTWTFSDPDAGDSQSAFDLQYRVQGTSTWTTVSASSTSSSYTFAANAFTAGATYEWQVRTYDSQGTVGPWSSSSFFTATTPPAAPTITAPSSGATISAATSTVTWSDPNQAHYQVRRVADSSGSPDTGTVYWDSGDVTDSTSRALSVAFPTNGQTEHVQVRIQYQGLWSPWADARVVVSYTPPAAPTVALTPLQATGALLVTITNPTPGGGQPAIDHNDIAVNDGAGLTRRATGIANNGTWTYFLPVSGRDYTAGNVRVTAVATNGTTTSGSS